MFKATRNDVQAQSWAALWGLSTGQTQLLGSNELGNATSCPNQDRRYCLDNRLILVSGKDSLRGSAMPTLLVAAPADALGASERRKIMNPQDLLGCIQSLREIRAQLDHLLDPSVSMEFDAIIGRLQECSDQRSDHRQLAKIVDSSVRFLGRLIDVTTNVSDLIDRYKR